LRLELLGVDVRNPEDFGPAFDAAVRQRAAAVAVALDALTVVNLRRSAELAAKHRLPSVYPAREFVNAGGLIAYGANYPDLYRRSVTYVDRIFRGAKPANLPIEQAMR
jgi:putative ABC transport system substrate-binding protein